MLALFTRTN